LPVGQCSRICGICYIFRVQFYYAITYMYSGIPKVHIVLSVNKACFADYSNFSYNNYFLGGTFNEINVGAE
jgi:hypothetical protein